MGLIGEIVAKTANDVWKMALTERQMAQLERYAELIVEWNATRMNLTRITEPAEMALKHFIDSLSVLAVVPPRVNARVVDIGTGAGLPGIVMKIARPDLQVTLLDSTAKKLTFCQAVIDDLELQGIAVLNGRAETVGRLPEHTKGYELAVARAVAPLEKLLPWCAPFVAARGAFVAMKGPAVSAEMEAAIPTARRFGLTLEPPREVVIPGHEGEGERWLVVGRRIARS